MTMKNTTQIYDIAIVGGGLSGMTAAIALANTGSEIALCIPTETMTDHRTTALLSNSVDFLKTIGIWQELQSHAFPLKTMRIVDGTNRLIRSPQTDFHASEIELEAFGYNVTNRDYQHKCEKIIKNTPNITVIESEVESVSTKEDSYRLNFSGAKQTKAIQARFIIGADGRNSRIRDQFNFGVREWAYPQSAIVYNFNHKFSNQFTSTEFHTESGPFTIVPHSEYSAGLVWMETPDKVEALSQMTVSKLALETERMMQSFLGKLEITSPVQSFPITGMTANVFGNGSCAIIGEAAHRFPPIGAQGFNLGIRDIQCLRDLFSSNFDIHQIGSLYHTKRRTDIHLRTTGVDALNRTLLSDFLPVQLARSLGLYTLGSLQGLRKYTMQAGISPAGSG